MSEQIGIKETKEAVEAVLAISKFVAARAKDGVGADDGIALVQKLLTDEEFKKVLEAGVEGAKQIPSEVKDLSLTESVELIVMGGKAVVEIVGELRK